MSESLTITCPIMRPKTPKLQYVALVACMLFSSQNSGVASFNTSPRSSVTRHQYCSLQLSPSQQVHHPNNGRRGWIPSSQLASNFYDDFEDFEDFGEIGDSSSSNSNSGDDKAKQDASSSLSNSGDTTNFGSGSNDDNDDAAVMKSLRDRMSEMSSADDYADFEEDDDEYEEGSSGSALPDLEGNTLSSIDDLIGFAQAKARQKAADDIKKGKKKKAFATGTWEDENWANPIPHLDEFTGELLDLEDILERGVVLLANPAKFCSDLAESDEDDDKKSSKGNSFIGGLFDDPFPTFGDSESSSSSSSSISPALLAKFGITLPPSPDLGPDRRADLLPVVILIDRDPSRGSQAMLLNRRTGNLMGDLPPTLFESTGSDDASDDAGFTPHPLAAFMIQPLWWAGSSPSISKDSDDDDDDPTISRGGGVKAIDMLHACPYVKGCTPLPKADGLYWGGDPVQAQKAMKDERLEKPMSGFDFKFFIQTTRWLPTQLEQEIKDGTWYVATVSKEVLFRSRDRLGAKRAKPLWTEIIELLGDDYKHIRDQLYGDEDD